MGVEITHLQTSFHTDDSKVCAYAEWVMSRVAGLTPEVSWHELSLVLTDDSIRSLNQSWFGKDSVTDVISFAYPEEGFGEVIVNLQQAVEEGRLRYSPDHELALYIAHGCHHLTGAEDDTPEKKAEMLSLEEEWVRDSGALAGGLFR